jgi:VWFA-related protein
MKPRLFFSLIMIFAMCVQTKAPLAQKNAEEGFQIAVQTQLVEVYLTVTRGNQLIPNLRAPDFIIAEDGLPVGLDHLDNQDVPLHLALLVDTSESVQDSLDAIQNAAISFINCLHRQDRVTLIFFNSEITVFQQTTDDRNAIIKEIKNAQASGMTRLYDSIILGMRQLEGKHERKAIVCFTDGDDTSGASSRGDVLNAAARSGLPIYTIGAGAGLELSTLKIILQQFADINGGRAFFIQSLNKLRSAFEAVGEELRSAYALSYYTQIPQDGRWHELSIRTVDPQLAVHSRKGFFAGIPKGSK